MKRASIILLGLFISAFLTSVTMAQTPGSISGTIFYSGSQTGTIYVVAYEDPSTPPPYRTSISEPAPYTLNVFPGTYILRAFMDINGNGIKDWDEPIGEPIGRNWTSITVGEGEDVTGVDIALTEPGSISGMVYYGGVKQGKIYVSVYTDPTLVGAPIYRISILEPGPYIIYGVKTGTYYIRALLDMNGNKRPESFEPKGIYGAPDKVVVKKGEQVTGVDITLY